MDAPVPIAHRPPPRKPMGPLLSFLVFGTLAVLAIGGGLWGVILFQQRQARQHFDVALTYADGPPQYRTRLDPAWRPAPSGVTPRVGDELKTEAGARTVLTFDGRTSLRMSRNTSLRIEDVARAERLEIRVRLLSGRLWVDASPSEHVVVLTDAGEVDLGGRAAEIRVDARASEILAWQGRAGYVALPGDPPRYIEEGQALLLTMGGTPAVKKAPRDRDVWQRWNLEAQSGDLAAGNIPSLGKKVEVATAPRPAPTSRPAPRAPATIDVVPRRVRPRAGVYGVDPPRPRAASPTPTPDAVAMSQTAKRGQAPTLSVGGGQGGAFDYPAGLTHSGLPDLGLQIDSAGYRQEPVVHSEERAREIYDQVSRELVGKFNMTCRLPIAFRMVGSRDYESEGGRSLKDGVMGLTKSTAAGHKVFVLEGLDGDEFYAVVAHEYAHCFMHERGARSVCSNQVLNEGFSTWIEYKYYVLHGAPTQARVFLDPAAKLSRPSQYVDGLRRMVEMERRSGEYGVFHFVMTGQAE